MDPKETIAASEAASGAAAGGLLARVGRGKRLHMISSDGLTALCGRGPVKPVVSTIENLCAECASIAAALPVRKCQICGKVFRGEICPAQTEYDAEIGDYVHPGNPTHHERSTSEHGTLENQQGEKR